MSTGRDNKRWVVAAYPSGDVDPSSWKLVNAKAAEPGPGQILVRTLWLSVDPYLRGRLSIPSKGGAGIAIGDVMTGGGVGEVVKSNHPAWTVGDIVEALNVGWEQFSILTPDLPGPAAVNRVHPDFPPQAALHWLGMPGLTAYFGMLEIGRPRPGDVVVVSAAAGAVGQIAGQLAKLAGCRVVGIAGSDSKLEYCKSIGFDDTINYRNTDNLVATVAAACPNGVNVFFDGTGGPIHDAVMMNLAIGARVAIVGRVAVASKAPSQDIGLRASSRLIATRASLQGLVVFDWWHRKDEAQQRLKVLHANGALHIKEDVLVGLDMVPEAFVRMMRGENLGKQLVQVA